jgi:hypothetical protein
MTMTIVTTEAEAITTRERVRPPSGWHRVLPLYGNFQYHLKSFANKDIRNSFFAPSSPLHSRIDYHEELDLEAGVAADILLAIGAIVLAIIIICCK